TLINTMSNKRLDTDGVKEKFGVMPNQIIDYLTLMGDTSDNIPGVPQCGPKTAAKWLGHYQTLDNLVAHAHEIGGKIGDNLRESLAILPLSKRLVTIKTDVLLPLTLSSLTLQPAHDEEMVSLTRELEFKSWLADLLKQSELTPKQPELEDHQALDFELISTDTQWRAYLQKLAMCTLFCVDTETTSLDIIDAEIVGIAMAIDAMHPVYIPLAHDEASPQLERERVLADLKPILAQASIEKIGQNLKYDYHMFKNHGITLAGIAYDTMLESYLLNSSAGRHDMDSLALRYLGHKTIHFEDVAGSGAKQLRFNQIPIEKAAPYAAEDASITYRLHSALYPLMDESLRRVFHEIEMPLVPVLANMERYGVLIDKDVLLKHGERLKARISSLQAEALQLAGKDFNLNSPKQLLEILYTDLQLPILSKTPKGQPSTAEAVLQELAYEHRFPAVILEYRGLSKLVSTYIDALPRKVNSKTGRVHTSYNQTVAATGRLSSSDPNLQNIPVRSEEGRLIRKAFVAPKDHVLLAADYSQIELRIMAHLSQDANLKKAFANGWDIHAATASELFSVPIEDVTSEHRRRAKAVNFGLIYGMSAFGLAKQLGVGRQDAQLYIDTYFERYPGVLNYMEQTRKQAHEQGYVETLFGRRLYLPEINARQIQRQKAAERMAINAPMQGTAADIIKKTMIAIAACLSKQSTPDITMTMQVHDELVFEVRESVIEMATQSIRNLMEHTVELSVPLVVSIGVGQDWDAAH
ncbi:MAG: DNA polymerase I, partial [Legionellales bacterium]|nr:DNA polymerase I [Legionellales bacterium]